MVAISLRSFPSFRKIFADRYLKFRKVIRCGMLRMRLFRRADTSFSSNYRQWGGCLKNETSPCSTGRRLCWTWSAWTRPTGPSSWRCRPQRRAVSLKDVCTMPPGSTIWSSRRGTFTGSCIVGDSAESQNFIDFPQGYFLTLT